MCIGSQHSSRAFEHLVKHTRLTDVSISQYDFFEENVTSRIMFATSVLHAYGHQWACQLHFNPRLRHGLGLTDGEGVERLWSMLRRIIGPERRSSVSRGIHSIGQFQL